MFTAQLLMARAMLIAWVSLAVIPLEILHDEIDAELERRGIAPGGADHV